MKARSWILSINWIRPVSKGIHACHQKMSIEFLFSFFGAQESAHGLMSECCLECVWINDIVHVEIFFPFLTGSRNRNERPKKEPYNDAIIFRCFKNFFLWLTAFRQIFDPHNVRDILSQCIGWYIGVHTIERRHINHENIIVYRMAFLFRATLHGLLHSPSQEQTNHISLQ